MLRTLPVLLAALTLLPAARVLAHCQVPCGIYGDQRRFEEMLEDTETITKAIDQIGQLAASHGAGEHNQLVRWVVNKESHASNIQKIIGDYFLAQRVKSDNPAYVEQLKASHAVIVAAMKCKQAADPATAEALKSAILNLYRAYEGKEPQLGRAGGENNAQVSQTAGHAHSDHNAPGAHHGMHDGH